jgi:hypothetical protein
MYMRWEDDHDLLAALHQAIKARSQLPPEIIEAARNAYTWHTIDAELAEIVLDSGREPQAVAGNRSESASIRTLTFTSPHLTIEAEVTENSLIGQVIPPREGTMQVQTSDGATITARVDEIGCFLVEQVPPGPFRLHFKNHGINVVTDLITL